MTSTVSPIHWPKRYNLLGVEVSATDYDETVDRLIEAARLGYPAIASFHAVHAIISASHDQTLRERVNSFEIVAADGQPVRWTVNWLYDAGMKDRVYGPETMLRICHRAEDEGIPIYLYGSPTEAALEKLQARLLQRFPELLIAGAECPPFRKLTPDEDEAMVKRVNGSGAKLVFIGLGCPKQDHFAYEHRDRIQAVQLCVGAAFDFHSGTKKMAPKWMSRHGLEWFFRVCSEPRRLGKRYLTTNSAFMAKFAKQWISQKLLAKRS